MQRAVAGIVAMALSLGSGAQGTAFVDGRFPGQVTEFRLTPDQRERLDLFRRCRDNQFSPYVFRLSAEQSAKLKRAAGQAPSRFAIVESYRGEIGDELGVNVINRFSVDGFEIPHATLRSDAFTRKFETQTMGWKPSPLLKHHAVKGDSECPKWLR